MIAAIIGGGVIGGGWAALFLLNGWDVAVFGKDASSQARIRQVLANRSLPQLYDRPMPPEGKLSFSNRPHDVVGGADRIQESVPERLDITAEVFAKISAAAGASSIDEVEAPRDDNLAAIIGALKFTRSAAGKVVLDDQARFAPADRNMGGSNG